jgi:Domain of unknown function (DUF1929)
MKWQNMGQRFVELESTYTVLLKSQGATLHVSQLPPNAAILAPGPALIFVVVDGVPSVGKMVMVGSGQIEEQTMLEVSNLPPSDLLGVNARVSNMEDAAMGGAVSSSLASTMVMAGCLLLGLMQMM